MKRSEHGFTMLEIIVVLVLMAIVSAYAIGRSAGTQRMELAGQADKISNHIRYAQAMALKQSDTVWGITCDANDYSFFQTDTATLVMLPGETSNTISLSGLGVGMDAFTLFFDNIGKPYTAYTDASTNTPVSTGNPLEITITAGGSMTLTITPETGLIQ